MNLSEKLIHLRKEKKLSQLQLAEILGVSRQAVSKWESGNTMPDITNIIELGRFYNVSLDYLLISNILDEYKDRKYIPLPKAKRGVTLNKLIWFVIILVAGFILGITLPKLLNGFR